MRAFIYPNIILTNYITSPSDYAIPYDRASNVMPFMIQNID